jgi:hypothetical protein
MLYCGESTTLNVTLPVTTCHGFTSIAKLKPGDAAMRSYDGAVEQALEADPFFLAPLKLHYLK